MSVSPEPKAPVAADILAAVDRFTASLWAGDLDIARQFASGSEVILATSEYGPTAHGHEEISALLTDLIGQSFRVRWDFSERHVRTAGDLAWFFGEAELVIAQEGVERRHPYRMTGVLRNDGEAWRWLHFHGSEPK